MHKLFEITDLTNIITAFVFNKNYFHLAFPNNNDELDLCNKFGNVLVVHSNLVQKMENYHDIINLEIRDKITLFPKRLKCLYIKFAPYHEHKNSGPKHIFGVNTNSNIFPSQYHEEKMKKTVSWLESIYETLPSSLIYIGFANTKKNSVMLKSMLPKSVRRLNVGTGCIVNKSILTQLTRITVNTNESIDDFPDNIESIRFTNKNCQQKITKLPKNLKTIDLYANKNHLFKCKKYEYYDDHHKRDEFVHNWKKYMIRKNCKEHDFIYPIPNVTTIIANACLFDGLNQIKLPEKLDKLIIYECTCSYVHKLNIMRFIKRTNTVVEFINNMTRSCF